jgi:heterodisulfide reductase subunit C
MNIPITSPPDTLQARVEAISGQRLAGCYACGTCAASCPFRAEMDLPPDALIRHLLFDVPGVLDRGAFWVCVGCDLCSGRCPRAIDVPRVMDALRQVWMRERGDRLDVAALSDGALRELPPIALVAGLRRNTG